jgi:uncharacterized membrane protein YheB (UPF0754 family)
MDLGNIGELQLTAILPWLLPPLLGAVIGYVTNAIAIRMLFRPLTDIRVLGVRLPLTPGIIPKQRLQLAESIGRMVSKELLTEQAVRRQLTTQDFRSRLESNIDALLGDIIATPLAQLQRGNQELVYKSVEGFLSEALYSFFSSRSFIHGVRSILGRLVHSLGEKKVEQLIGETEVGPWVVQRIMPLISQSDSRAGITAAVEGWLEQRRRGEQSMGDLLSPEILLVLTDLLATLFPSALDSLFSWLDQEDTREEMNHRGKRLLRTVLEKLNVLQRFLISAGQFDRTLEQKMPEILDEAMAALRGYAYDPETLAKLKGVLLKTFSRWTEESAADLFARIPEGMTGQLVERLLEGLQREGTQKRIAGGIDRVLKKIKQRTLAQILNRYLRISEQEAVDYTTNKVLAFLASKETAQAIASEVVSFSRNFIEEHRDGTIAELLHIEADLQKRAATYLCTQLIRIIDARLPAFIESFDVYRLVVDKINGLDVGQVEKLLLIVIQKHLRWINIFGAVLGALIGFSQLLLRLLGS